MWHYANHNHSFPVHNECEARDYPAFLVGWRTISLVSQLVRQPTLSSPVQPTLSCVHLLTQGPQYSDFNFPYQLLEIRLIFFGHRCPAVVSCRALPILRLDFFYNLLQLPSDNSQSGPGPGRCHNRRASSLGLLWCDRRNNATQRNEGLIYDPANFLVHSRRIPKRQKCPSVEINLNIDGTLSRFWRCKLTATTM